MMIFPPALAICQRSCEPSTYTNTITYPLELHTDSGSDITALVADDCHSAADVTIATTICRASNAADIRTALENEPGVTISIGGSTSCKFELQKEQASLYLMSFSLDTY